MAVGEGTKYHLGGEVLHCVRCIAWGLVYFIDVGLQSPISGDSFVPASIINPKPSQKTFI